MPVREFKGTTRFGRHVPVDPVRCKAGLWQHFDFNQCGNKAKKDGWCGIHHPEAEAKRRAKSDALYAQYRESNREAAERIRQQNDCHKECASAIKSIANGHNDPRGLCEEILQRFGEIIS